MQHRFLVTVVIAVALAGIGRAQQADVSALDYAQIRQLYARSAVTLDTGADNGNAYARLFLPDAVLVDESGATIAGRERLAAYARGTSAKSPTNMQHFIYNVRVDRTAAGVTGLAYVVLATVNGGGQATQVANGGQYHDELVKSADGWQIKARRFVRAASTGVPVAQQPSR